MQHPWEKQEHTLAVARQRELWYCSALCTLCSFAPVFLWWFTTDRGSILILLVWIEYIVVLLIIIFVVFPTAIVIQSANNIRVLLGKIYLCLFNVSFFSLIYLDMIWCRVLRDVTCIYLWISFIFAALDIVNTSSRFKNYRIQWLIVLLLEKSRVRKIREFFFL